MVASRPNEENVPSGSAPEALTWPDLISELLERRDLPAEHTSWVMNEVMGGTAPPVALAGFLVALAAKGETVSELVGLADEMVHHALDVPIPLGADGEPIQTVDIVGTGGDRHQTVNISTMAALVVAGAGIPVAKHGNRAASSASGSADVLEALGIRLDVSAQRAGALISEVGITFLFAQKFHPAFRHAATARVGLGVPTAFNVLGPITNPARPRAGAIGVGSAAMAPLIAGVFAERGNSTLVFRSEDGLDELATTAPVKIWEVTRATGGQVREHVLDLRGRWGMQAATIPDLRGGSPAQNAEIAQDVFAGASGPIRDAVLLNAAAAIVADERLLTDPTADLLDRLAEGVEVAAAAIDEGRAQAVLEKWAVESNR